MREHVLEQRIQNRIVKIRSQNSFAQIVEHDDARASAQSAERFLMQFGPGARTRTKDQQANRFAAITERHHEQPRASILAALWITNHGTGSVIDLAFFSGRSDDDAERFWPLNSAEFADESLHGLIAAVVSTGNQILPNRLGIASTTQSQLDGVTVRLAGTDGRCPIARLKT